MRCQQGKLSFQPQLNESVISNWVIDIYSNNIKQGREVVFLPFFFGQKYSCHFEKLSFIVNGFH